MLDGFTQMRGLTPPLLALAVALLWQPPPAAATGSCTLQPLDSGEQGCVCTDGTTEWDVTAIADDLSGENPTAKGACSGSYCQGDGFEYHLGICQQATPITSCRSGACCTASMGNMGYRVDTSAACPPATTCQVHMPQTGGGLSRCLVRS